MSIDEINKDRTPTFAFVSQGTALGTSSIIDTTSWSNFQIMAHHGGTGGSRTVTVYANGGTQIGTSATAFPNPVVLGTANSDQAGLGDVVKNVGILTHQAIITVGTSSNSSFSLSYLGND